MLASVRYGTGKAVFDRGVTEMPLVKTDLRRPHYSSQSAVHHLAPRMRIQNRSGRFTSRDSAAEGSARRGSWRRIYRSLR